MAAGGFDAVYEKFRTKYGEFEDDEFLSSGSVILDTVLSGGRGVPLGTLIEISSQSGAGKSSALLHIAKSACARGHKVLYLDPEHSVTESQITGFGLKQFMGESFIYLPVVTFEDAEEVIMATIEDPDLVYIIVDSVTALVPSKLLEKGHSIGDVEPGLQARFAALFYQKFKPMAKKNQVTMWFINQVRTKFDFRRGGHEEAAGGTAQKFYMDIRLFMRITKKLEQTVETADGPQSVPYGAENSLWAEKNRYERPFIPLSITILFGRGISNAAAYVKFLTRSGFIKQGGGGYYKIQLPDMGEQTVRGTPALNQWVKENIKDVKSLVENSGGMFLVRGEKDD